MVSGTQAFTVGALSGGGGAFYYGTGNVEAMRIDSSGNVGIGGAPSNGKFHVIGDWVSGNATVKAQTVTSIASGGTVGYGTFNNDGTRLGYFYSNGNFTAIGSSNSAPFIFETAGAERARFDTSGNFLFSCTSIPGAGGSNGIALRPNGTETANTPRFDIVGAASTVNNTVMQVYSNGASNYRFYVQWNGQIYATQTSITGISDRSLKTNIRDLDTGLAQVMALKPRRFDWINGDAADVAGFVAQEVEDVLPDLVYDYKYSKDSSNSDVMKKGLKMGDMLPTLVKAIQELKAEFDAYKLTHP
jgi:hypothetical protein